MRIDRQLLNEDGNIDFDAWALRHAANLGVGHCECGGILVAGGAHAWERMGSTRWLVFECPSCRKEHWSPDGRLAQRPHALLGR